MEVADSAEWLDIRRKYLHESIGLIFCEIMPFKILVKNVFV